MNTLRNSRWSQRALEGLDGLRSRSQRPPYRPVPQAATYWRRRFVALVVGLATLALVSWAFSGALGGGSPSAGHRGTGANATAGGQGSQPGTGGGAREAGSTPAAHQKGTAARKRFRPRPCPHGDVVLSLFSSQASYGARQLPQFTVDVVATARRTCTFDVGAQHIALVIFAGSVRVWSSADCVQGAGDLVSDLQRGVPTVVPISWNRQASSAGCPATSSTMPAGSYTATVSDGTLVSNSISFRIG
ncbi:MAG TPA: hypothetical protein VGG25_16330 [Streptosporangiaceae bacterium]